MPAKDITIRAENVFEEPVAFIEKPPQDDISFRRSTPQGMRSILIQRKQDDVQALPWQARSAASDKTYSSALSLTYPFFHM